MTDETPAPSTPGTFVCPEKGCRALIPDTIEDRREHRSGHTHDAKVVEAMRRSLRELREDFDTLRGKLREEVKEIRDDVQGIDRAVGKIEIPEPVAPLTITRGGWDDDDLGDEPAEPDVDDDWGFRPAPEPEAAPADDAATAGEPAESAADLDDAIGTPSAFAPGWRRS